MPGAGALAFPCAPDASPVDEPAQWSPQALAAIVIHQAPLNATSFPLPDIAAIRADQILRDGRHLVVDVGKLRFRLLLRAGDAQTEAAFLIPAGPEQASRAETTARFLRVLEMHGKHKLHPFAPTAYARQRLTQYLALIDARSEGYSTRDIARLLVFPRSQLPQGAAWKGSGERRHTLRLIAKSRHMLQGGFRSLPGFIALAKGQTCG